MGFPELRFVPLSHRGWRLGGEYTAIASTIQEFVPARYRGWTDLVINGSFDRGGTRRPAAQLCSSTPPFCRLTSAGAPPSLSARCWGSSSSWCAHRFRKHHALAHDHGRPEEARRLSMRSRMRIAVAGITYPMRSWPRSACVPRDFHTTARSLGGAIRTSSKTYFRRPQPNGGGPPASIQCHFLHLRTRSHRLLRHRV